MSAAPRWAADIRTWASTMADRGVRTLSNIGATASSSRVLHLTTIAKKHADDPEHGERPMFQNRLLNRSIIIRHRLRRDELELIDRTRMIATKILTPIDFDNLGCGGRYLFVG